MMTKHDADLKEDVTRELAWDTRIDDSAIGVAVDRGVVTLTGTVSCWADKHAVEEAAHRVAGVLDVANDITIKPTWSTDKSDADIARSVRSALAWNRFGADRTIQSTVTDHGFVRLTGTVRTLSESEEAERVVLRVDGVRNVSNDLVVEAPAVAPHALRTAITAALGRHVAREASRISIEVHGDKVILTGNVESWRERRAALGAAKGTLGVKHVDDRLRIA